MQDRASGARASKWGHETARALAARIGASSMRRSSNECRYKGLLAVIKCAGAATKSVGVTYKMLDRLEIVIGAFECEDGTFELWSLSPAQFFHARDAQPRCIRGQSRHGCPPSFCAERA